MLTRRKWLAASTGTLMWSALGGARARKRLQPAGAPEDILIALPGKKPLIKRTFRPPNFETPLADLRQRVHGQRCFLRSLSPGRHSGS
jgi:hypothetical protein